MNKATFLKKWADYLYTVRTFFRERGYTEVSTPALVPAGAFEASIDTLQVTSKTQRWQLHSSPEIEMKALLAETSVPLFQIARCFRDDPPSPVHFVEFTMLEFYTPGVDYRHSIQLTKSLFEALNTKPLVWEEFSVEEAFRRFAGIELSLTPTAQTLHAAIKKTDLILPSADDGWEDLYFKILIERIEPALHVHTPTLLRDYPASQAALARLDPSKKFAERFEIYWKGMELCNGCTELNDVSEMKARYVREQILRKQRNAPPHPYPNKLESAIQATPLASGVAVGLERLFMALYEDSGEFFCRTGGDVSS